MTAWWHRVAAPELAVTVEGANGGTERRLRPGLYRVGRDPKADIVVTDSKVSWNHAVLQADGDAWFVEDRGSRNGTFAGPNRIGRLNIDGECTVRLGSADDGPALTLSVTPPAPAARPRPADIAIHPSRVDLRPTNRLPIPGRTVRIGRAEDNDVRVDDLSVSRHHAELRRTGDGYQIVDLGSRNGTFLNGGLVFVAPVTGQDIVGIGPATFRLAGDELREFLDQGDVSLVARELTVRAGERILLDRVSFPVGERSLVAVIGPSGAGKSTLLGALTGLRPATQGVVLYDNRDLYAEYTELRHRIALVPQDDVIYPKLTPRRFLGYAAELRFPGDTTAQERGQRVQEVIDELKPAGSERTRARVRRRRRRAAAGAAEPAGPDRRPVPALRRAHRSRPRPAGHARRLAARARAPDQVHRPASRPAGTRQSRCGNGPAAAGHRRSAGADGGVRPGRLVAADPGQPRPHPPPVTGHGRPRVPAMSPSMKLRGMVVPISAR